MSRILAAFVAVFLCVPAQASECRSIENMVSAMAEYRAMQGVFSGTYRAERYKALYARVTGRDISEAGSGYIVWILPSGYAQLAMTIGTDACYLLTVPPMLIPSVRAFLTEPGA